MHVDGQTATAFVIVAVAFYVVGRRIWTQIAAFRGRPPRRKTNAPPRPAPPPQLIQLQTRPPLHLKRPPADDK